MADYIDVESGKRADREQPTPPFHHAKVTGGTLMIAKLDRQSGSAAFLTTPQESGAKFIAADMPDCDETTAQLYAVMAQRQGKAISEHTNAALATAKAREAKLGKSNGAAGLRKAGKRKGASLDAIKGKANTLAKDRALTIDQLRSEGTTRLPQLAGGLNEGGFPAPRGGKWLP